MSRQENARWFSCQFPKILAAARVFTFPFAGGGASVYRDWGKRLPPFLEAVSVKLPGREDRIREKPFASASALVTPLAAAIEPFLSATPFAFYGHSMGALIGFELALELRRRGLPAPAALFLAAYPAPRPEEPRASRLHLSDAEFLREVRSFGGPHSAWDNPDILDLFLPILRADFSLCDSYQLSSLEPLHVPIFAVGGESDPKVSPASLIHWSAMTTGPFRHLAVPGGHFFLEKSSTIVLDLISTFFSQTVCQAKIDKATR